MARAIYRKTMIFEDLEALRAPILGRKKFMGWLLGASLEFLGALWAAHWILYKTLHKHVRGHKNSRTLSRDPPEILGDAETY